MTVENPGTIIITRRFGFPIERVSTPGLIL